MTLEDRILFVDGEAIVIDKPAGLPVDAPRAGGPSVEARIDELKLNFARPPVAMHRLDTDTSGCLLFARNANARKVFQQAFESGTVEKSYLAVVEGVPAESDGVIDLPLAKFSTAASGWRMVPDEAGKHARTRWRLVGSIGDRSLVEFVPETGRTHQIRVHAARGLGCAIVGDPVYDERDTGPEADLVDGVGEGMLLHARTLKVPRGKKPSVGAVAPMPERFGIFLDLLSDEA
jgi:tRNA pseudouridine32 synthase/23S rRNA pseudouridine746 synthase